VTTKQQQELILYIKYRNFRKTRKQVGNNTKLTLLGITRKSNTYCMLLFYSLVTHK